MRDANARRDAKTAMRAESDERGERRTGIRSRRRQCPLSLSQGRRSNNVSDPYVTPLTVPASYMRATLTCPATVDESMSVFVPLPPMTRTGMLCRTVPVTTAVSSPPCR